jgi:hypothetical protein
MTLKYAQRAIMKALRNFKHRALCKDLYKLATGHSGNPLKKSVTIEANYIMSKHYIQCLRNQVDWEEASKRPYV